jgi:hypothetical protein
MGTSAPGGGPRPTTPLIPDWIANPGGLPPDQPNETPDAPQPDPQNPNQEPTDPSIPDATPNIPDPEPTTDNRFRDARSQYTSYSRNHGSDNRSAMRGALRSYVTTAGGGSRNLATRMRPSAARVATFYDVVNRFKQGVETALRFFNLSNYRDKPVVDILGALTDFIFSPDGQYSDIQDDSITKYAYANTITRIAEIEEINLDSLSNENIELMLAIFIEETIATRVICDVGTKLYEHVEDPQEILDVEETTYQIVSGLVRTQIMPEIIATQRGQSQNIEQSIERIYRTAFDCIAGASEA